jgi:hypothetical protein
MIPTIKMMMITCTTMVMAPMRVLVGFANGSVRRSDIINRGSLPIWYAGEGGPRCVELGILGVWFVAVSEEGADLLLPEMNGALPF